MSELMTVSEVGDALRVDDTTVRRWVKQGILEAVVLPHVNKRQAYRIKRTTFDNLMAQTTIPVQSRYDTDFTDDRTVPNIYDPLRYA